MSGAAVGSLDAGGEIVFYGVPGDVTLSCTQSPAPATVWAYTTCGSTSAPPIATGVVNKAVIAWFAPGGFFDPLSPGSPLLSPPVQSCLVQLVDAGPDGVADPPDPSAPYCIGGDDRMLQFAVVVNTRNNGFAEYAAGTFGTCRRDFYTPFSVYARVFEDETPQTGEHYYVSSLLPVVHSEPPAAQFFDINENGMNGDQLTNVISATLSTNVFAGGPVPVLFAESITGSPCNRLVTRTWTATDACTHAAVATQRMVLADNKAPKLSLPTNCAIPCASSWSPTNTGRATANDGCDPAPLVTYADESSGTCPGYIRRTWMAADACGNTTSGVQIITLEGIASNVTVALVVPANVTIACGSSTAPSNTGQALVLGGCPPATGGVLSAQYTDRASTASCPRVITRRWSVSDPCGSSASGEQQITVADEAAPLLVVPPDTQVECAWGVDPAITGWASAQDACQGVVGTGLTYEDTVIGASRCERTILRRWVAVDACGNSVARTQSIFVAMGEVEPLVLAGVPADEQVACDEVAPPALVTTLGGCPAIAPSLDATDLQVHYSFDAPWTTTVADSSGQGHAGDAVGVSFEPVGRVGGAARFDGNDEITVPGISLSNRSYTVTLWAKPSHVLQPCCNAGRSVLVALGSNAHARGLQFGYEWTGQFLLCHFGDDLMSSGVYPDEGTWHFWAGTFDRSTRVQRVYRDGVQIAERTASSAFIGSGPLLIGRGFGPFAGSRYKGLLDELRVFTRELASNEIAALTREVAPPRVMLDETVDGACPRVITRVWTATDACGATATATQRITVVDEDPPVLQGVPPDMVVNCLDLPPVAKVDAMDACSGVTVDDSALALFYSFTGGASNAVWDSSGHAHHGVLSGAVTGAGRYGAGMVFDGVDDFISAPDLELAGTSFTLAVWAKPGAASQDCCDAGRQDFFGQGVEFTGEGLQFGYEWTGNVLLDFYNADAYTPASYPGDAGAWHLWVGTYDATADLQRIYRDGVLVTTRATEGDYQGTGPFLIGKGPGRFGASTFGGMLDEIRVYRRALASNEVAALFSGGNVPVQFAESGTGSCPAVVTRTWTATDACGNTTSASQRITTAELGPLVLAGVPEDMLMSCGAAPPPPVVEARGGCTGIDGRIPARLGPEDTGVSISWYASGGFFHPSNPGVTPLLDPPIQSTLIQLISAGLNGTIDQVDLLRPYALGGDDRLLMQLVLTNRANDGFTEYAAHSFGTYREVFESPFSFYARVFEDAAPEVGDRYYDSVLATATRRVAPGTQFFDLNRSYNGDDLTNIVRSSAPDPDASPVFFVETTNDAVCPRVITRTWTATDRCGQTVAATQRITVVVTEGLELHGVPGDLTVDCGGIPSPALVTATAQCIGNHELVPMTVHFDETWETGCPKLIRRVWTAADLCGSRLSATQRITVVDTEAPVLQGAPADLVVNCGEVPPPAQVLAMDRCEAGVSSEGLVLYCPFDRNETGTVTDASGYGHIGYENGAFYTTNGYSGGAFVFKTGSSIAIPDLIEVQNQPALTWGAWLRPTNAMAVEGYVLSKSDRLGNAVFNLLVDESRTNISAHVVGRDGTWRTVQHTGAIRPDQWQHLMATYDGTRLRLYLDGQLMAVGPSYPFQRTPQANALTTLGRTAQAGSQSFEGQLDDVRVYRRMLSDEEVRTVYAMGGGARPVPVIFSQTQSGGCPRVITRTWTASDECGNSVTATQRITVADASVPILHDVPPDLLVNCGQVPAPPVVTATDPCPGAVSTDGLIRYYPFDANEGGSLIDASGHGLTGHANGAMYTTHGYRGGAFAFTNHSYVDLGHVSEVNGKSALTWGAWIMPGGGGQGGIMGKSQPTNGVFQMTIETSGRHLSASVHAGNGEGRSVERNGLLATGKWQHVMATYDGTTMRLYHDGLLVASDAWTNSQPTRTNSLHAAVGQVSTISGPFFEGLIDEVRIYQRVLSDQEIYTLYRGVETGTVTVQFAQTVTGDCPQAVVRTWTAADACGNAARATQRITAVSPESDGDGLNDYQELQLGTDPYRADTDGDGRSDGLEVAQGTDALDDASYPKYVQHDFDGDLKADVAYYGGASGTWHIALSGTASSLVQQFGYTGFVPVPGDYDGDGRADFGLYLPGWGNWFLLQSRAGFTGQQFGFAGTLPVPADYDGDGRTDIAVHDPAKSDWFLLNSKDGFTAFHFGSPMGTPLAADYDGDGKADPTVFKAGSPSRWFQLLSSGQAITSTLGSVTARPLPADFDGDGRADLAIFDTSNNRWTLRFSTTSGTVSFVFGLPGSVPVRGDYDGDGQSDPGVYDAPGQRWIIGQSQDGLKMQTFGTPGIVPIGSQP